MEHDSQHLADAKTLASDLDDLYSDRDLIIEEIDEKTGPVRDKMDTLQEEIDELTDKMQDLRDEAKKAAAEEWGQLEAIDDEIKSVEQKLKSACYALPTEELMASGVKARIGRVNFSISKVSASVEYDIDGLLKAMPHLTDVKGLVKITRTINTKKLDKLVADGVVNDDDLASFKKITRKRNPSVRITREEEAEIPDGV